MTSADTWWDTLLTNRLGVDVWEVPSTVYHTAPSCRGDAIEAEGLDPFEPTPDVSTYADTADDYTVHRWVNIGISDALEVKQRALQEDGELPANVPSRDQCVFLWPDLESACKHAANENRVLGGTVYRLDVERLTASFSPHEFLVADYELIREMRHEFVDDILRSLQDDDAVGVPAAANVDRVSELARQYWLSATPVSSYDDLLETLEDFECPEIMAGGFIPAEWLSVQKLHKGFVQQGDATEAT